MMVSEYEAARETKIGENAAFLAQLGLAPKNKAGSGRVVGRKEGEGRSGGRGITTSEEARWRRRRAALELKWRWVAEGEGVHEVGRCWPCREAEVRQLASVVTGRALSGAVVALCGPAGSGKSATTRAVLEACGEPFAWISAAALPRDKSASAMAAAFLAHAAAGLLAFGRVSSGVQGAAEGRASCHSSSSESADAATLASACDDVFAAHGCETATLVLDDAGPAFAPAWSALPQFGGGGSPGNKALEAAFLVAFAAAARRSKKVALRLLVVGDGRTLSGCLRATEPLWLNFPAYTPFELPTVLVAVCRRRRLVPPGLEAKFHLFAEQIVAIGSRSTRDVRDLAKLAASKRLFAAYASNGRAECGYAALVAVFHAAVRRIDDPYLDVDRLVDAHLHGHANPDADATWKRSVIAGGGLLDDLPHQTRCLVLAAYVASHSHRGSDRRLFTNASGPRKKKQRATTPDERANLHCGEVNADTDARCAGAQPVPLDRLISIHGFILAAHDRPSALGHDTTPHHPLTLRPTRKSDLIQALTALVRAKLLDRSGLDDVSQPRFRCLLPTDDAFELAAALRFPLAHYLPAAT